MSDRHTVQKSFNKLLSDYRHEVLPTAIQDWDNLDDNTKLSLLRVNDFFCGLHFLVGLADQAEFSLIYK